jgi:hypothetical protein
MRLQDKNNFYGGYQDFSAIKGQNNKLNMEQEYILVDKVMLNEIMGMLAHLKEGMHHLKFELESLKNMTHQSEYITESELARELGTTKRYVANIRLRGELPFIRFGGENGKVVYTRSDVSKFMNKRKIGVY